MLGNNTKARILETLWFNYRFGFNAYIIIGVLVYVETILTYNSASLQRGVDVLRMSC